MDPHLFSLLDPDQRGKIFQIKTKNSKKLVIIASFQIFKVNLHKLLLLSYFYDYFQLKTTLYKVIFYKFCKAGSGSAFFKQLDPDP